MSALLVRGTNTIQGTLGRFSYQDFSCWSLELQWLNNLPQYSCVPAGDYSLVFTRTPHVHSGFRAVYQLLSVPGRSGILLHPGTFAGYSRIGFRTDSWGCILLGLSHGVYKDQLALFNSRTAIREFHEAANGQSLTLTIKESHDA